MPPQRLRRARHAARGSALNQSAILDRPLSSRRKGDTTPCPLKGAPPRCSRQTSGCWPPRVWLHAECPSAAVQAIFRECGEPFVFRAGLAPSSSGLPKRASRVVRNMDLIPQAPGGREYSIEGPPQPTKGWIVQLAPPLDEPRHGLPRPSAPPNMGGPFGIGLLQIERDGEAVGSPRLPVANHGDGWSVMPPPSTSGTSVKGGSATLSKSRPFCGRAANATFQQCGLELGVGGSCRPGRSKLNCQLAGSPPVVVLRSHRAGLTDNSDEPAFRNDGCILIVGPTGWVYDSRRRNLGPRRSGSATPAPFFGSLLATWKPQYWSPDRIWLKRFTGEATRPARLDAILLSEPGRPAHGARRKTPASSPGSKA